MVSQVQLKPSVPFCRSIRYLRAIFWQGSDVGYLAAMMGPFALVRKYVLDLCPNSLLSAAAEAAPAD